MSINDLAKVALVAGAGYVGWLWWQSRQGSTVGPYSYVTSGNGADNGGFLPGDTADTGTDYLQQLALAESNGQPYVKNTASSASGLFQFLKKEWLALGGAWGNDPNAAFGGLMPSPQEQADKAAALTQQNATALSNAGIEVNNATLYAAHFLGAGTAIKVLSADVATPLSSLLSSSVLKANPYIAKLDVGGFYNWAAQRIGG